MNEWLPPAPSTPPPVDPSNPLPPANSWNDVAGCTVGPNQPSITDGVVITGVPAQIVAPNAWGITLNDGSAPPNFTIDHYSAAGTLIDSPLDFSGVDGSAQFIHPVYLSRDPVEPMEAVNKEYVDAREFSDAPSDGNSYGRRNAAWSAVLPEAPIDGALYGRGAVAWTPISAQFMPYSGGVFTGVVTFPANNSVAINGAAGTQRSILAGSSSSWRWQILFADGTPETGSNAGSNFSINSLSDSGGSIATPFSINRATGAVTLAAGTQPPTLILNKGTAAPQGDLIQGQRNGVMRWQLNLANFNAELGNNLGSNFSIDRFDDTGAQLGVSPVVINRASGAATFGYGVTITGVLTLANTASLVIPGGASGWVLSTNGLGALSWVNNLPDAPTDGQIYARSVGQWVTVTGGGPGGDFLPLIGGTLTGALTVEEGSPTINLNKITGTGGNQYASIYGQFNGSNRWELCLGGAVAESGTSAGSDFILYRYDNTGAYIDIPFQVTRATGVSTFSQLPSFPGGASGQALTTNGAGALSWAGPYALTTALPPASTVVPLIDGVGAVGTSTAYARADHVHPVVYMGDNRIINGDMRIDQRNNGASGTAISVYTVDRWLFQGTQTGKGQWGRNLNAFTTTPSFPYYLGFQSQSAYTVLAGDVFAFRQEVEADMISDFAWGTANAQPATLSFWVFSNNPIGTFGGSIRNYAATRSYPFTYSILTAGVWTNIAVPIPADTGGTWIMSGNGGALDLCFDCGSGSTYRGSAGAWASGNFVGATGAVSILATNGAELCFTGVKLEIGSVATPYNRQSLAKSMADCQRYYQVGQIGFDGISPTAGPVYTSQPYPVQMRAASTMVIVANNCNNVGTPSFAGLSPPGMGLTLIGNIPAAGNYTLNVNYTASAEL